MSKKTLEQELIELGEKVENLVSKSPNRLAELQSIQCIISLMIMDCIVSEAGRCHARSPQSLNVEKHEIKARIDQLAREQSQKTYQSTLIIK
jgi:cell division protein ZapA (FtsZ GTPase activity inhibitor)